MRDDQHDLPEPGRRTGTSCEEDWMITDVSAILLMWTSLWGTSGFLPSKEAHFTLARY
jgi:hypothetical protein